MDIQPWLLMACPQCCVEVGDNACGPEDWGGAATIILYCCHIAHSPWLKGVSCQTSQGAIWFQSWLWKSDLFF